MGERSYWSKLSSRRLTRRRALAGAGAAGVGAAALSLAGCGGDEGPGAATGQGRGLLYTPVDTSERARAGGVMKGAVQTDVTTLDPLATSSFNTQFYVAYYTYPRIFKFKTAKWPEEPTGEFEGDLVESWELSPDKLRLTVKVRPGMRWDPREPTNGREIDASDVAFSWGKLESVSPFRGDIVYSEKNPTNPVESVSTPDARTVVFNMRKPDSTIFNLLAANSIFYVMPRESESEFDPKADVRGYGPWILDSYRSGVEFMWIKNPNGYYVDGRPLADKVEVPIITEYAQRLAQFRAGRVWWPFVRQEDILDTKGALPDTAILEGAQHNTGPHIILFGYAEGSPFRDERLRKAVSLVIDRESEADFRWDRPRFRDAGIPVETRYHNAVAAGWTGWWVDPTNSKFRHSNLFKYDLAEARKLIRAATGGDSLDTEHHWMNGPQYGSQYTRNVELMLGFLNAGGIRGKSEGHQYQTEYLPNYYYAYSPSGRDRTYKGLTLALERTYPAVVAQMFASYHPDGPRFHGISPDGGDPTRGDARVTNLLDRMKLEFDPQRQRGLVAEFQEYVIGKMYFVPGGPYPTSTKGFGLWWPAVGNLGVFLTATGGVPQAEGNLHWWVDDSQPPLSQA